MQSQAVAVQCGPSHHGPIFGSVPGCWWVLQAVSPRWNPFPGGKLLLRLTPRLLPSSPQHKTPGEILRLQSLLFNSLRAKVVTSVSL